MTYDISQRGMRECLVKTVVYTFKKGVVVVDPQGVKLS